MANSIAMSLLDAKQKLTPFVELPQLEAEILLSTLLKQTRAYLYAHADEVLSDDINAEFRAQVKRRCQLEPIAYITGTKEFWSIELNITPDVLIPRPETELLIEFVLNTFPSREDAMIVADLGTGSGAIALALGNERKNWKIHAVDISERALTIARKNAQTLSLTNVSFHLGNWCTALPSHSFDLLVSNPPYLSEGEWADYATGLQYEPITALLSGVDGLEAIRMIALQAKAKLKRNGMLVFEHGFRQGEKVREILHELGYQHIHSLRDLENRERVTYGAIA